METLKTMTMLNDDEDVPSCAINSKALGKVHLWIKYQKLSEQYLKEFKDNDLQDTFEMISAAEYLGNETLLEEMLRKVFCNYSLQDMNNLASTNFPLDYSSFG